VLYGRELRLTSLQSIRPELEDKEQEAWHKLLRVLTHEIMNSLTPITSPSQTAAQMAADENQPDLAMAMGTIHRRSAGLVQFVQSYRDLTRELRPRAALIDLPEYCARLAQLFPREFAEKDIRFTHQITAHTALAADPVLLEQVLVNILRNAAEAHATQITLHIAQERDKTHLAVTDNGTGILPEDAENIFVPFFTTRANGSGIGLSRQLVRAMNGEISLAPAHEGGTVATLRMVAVG